MPWRMTAPIPPNSHKASVGRPLSELTKRVLSGIVLMIVALVTTWTGGLVLVFAFSVLSFFVLIEWERLTGPNSQRRLVLGMLVVGAAASIAYFFGPVAAMAVGIGSLFVALGAALLESPKRWSLTGVAYASWLVVSLVSLRGHDSVGLSAILFVFAAVWATDIAAYFGGRAIGGPKLMPSVSPNKTWSGAISGALAAILVCVGYIAWADVHVSARTSSLALTLVSVGYIALMALALSVASQAGDLFESGLKRRFGAKDSGTLLPGHGGFMDRVDGLVFASAAAFLIGLSLKGQGTVAEGLLTLGNG
jgi:phosphatidate cytidylyltransferase